MDLKFWKQQKPEKSKSYAKEWVNSIVFAVVVATLFRWSAVEAYVIPSGSMENTLLVGDYLFVSKLHYGTRTPGTLLQMPLTHQKIWGTDIPSFLPWIQLPTVRLPGFSEVKRGDVVVFNGPTLAQNYGVQYPIDMKTHIVKRCVALPGDFVEVADRQVKVNSQLTDNPATLKLSYLVYSMDEVSPRNLAGFGLGKTDWSYLGRTGGQKAVYRMFLTDRQVKMIQEARYIHSVVKDYTTSDGPDDAIFPPSMNKAWNQDTYGPILVPKKGMKMAVNDSTLGFYGEIIRLFEHHGSVEINAGTLTIDGREIKEYTFAQDYYFMMGDNRHGSFDSRFWGFLPEDHVVGKALFTWFSVNQDADLVNKVRWNRVFRMIE